MESKVDRVDMAAIAATLRSPYRIPNTDIFGKAAKTCNLLVITESRTCQRKKGGFEICPSETLAAWASTAK